MSDLVSLIKCLSEQGLGELVPIKEENQLFPDYVMENISITGKKITVYNKLLYLYQSRDYSFVYSSLGPYSPKITEEIRALRKWIPVNEKVLNSADNYEDVSNFLTEFKKSIGEEITFDLLLELSIHEWNERNC